jgi:hypothetical protein
VTDKFTIAGCVVRMLEVFRSRAGLFVGIGWLLFVLSIPICLAVGAMAGFDAFYVPAHRAASLDAFDVKASEYALASAAFAAAGSSIALALKFRTAASVFVVAIWSVVIFGTQGTRLFVKPGPEYFERHLGQQVFAVPWQYAPAGPGRSTEENPHEIGFSAHLCLSNLKGAYDQDCRLGRQLYVFPKERFFADFDIHLWRERSAQMSTEPERDGYQSYAYSYTLPAGGPPHVVHYFVRQDSEGQLTRLVVCRLDSETLCSHHALVGNYWLRYDAPLTEGDTMDGKLAALVESWRRK